METAKDIFFLIGSTLGIFAFARSLAKPVVKSNQEKWEAVQENLTEEDIAELGHQVYFARRVRADLLRKISSFVEDIRQDKEYLRVGTFWRGRFEDRKKAIVDHYSNLRDYVQVPYWEPKSQEIDGEEFRVWEFSKSYFDFEHDGAYDDYIDHLDEAADCVNDIRREYRAMSELANAQLVEIPIAPLLAERRSELPEGAV